MHSNMYNNSFMLLLVYSGVLNTGAVSIFPFSQYQSHSNPVNWGGETFVSISSEHRPLTLTMHTPTLTQFNSITFILHSVIRIWIFPTSQVAGHLFLACKSCHGYK